MNLTAKIFLLAGLLLSLGCAPLTVDYDYDTTYDFTRLRSYDWTQSPTGNQMEELTEKRFQSAVNDQLKAKNYNREAGSPDFLVSMEGIKKTVTGGSTAVGAAIALPVGQHGSVSLGGGKSKPRVKQEGTLTLNITDARTGTLIWQGSATAALQGKTSPEEQQQMINQVVAEVLKNFPPKKK